MKHGFLKVFSGLSQGFLKADSADSKRTPDRLKEFTVRKFVRLGKLRFAACCRTQGVGASFSSNLTGYAFPVSRHGVRSTRMGIFCSGVPVSGPAELSIFSRRLIASLPCWALWGI